MLFSKICLVGHFKRGISSVPANIDVFHVLNTHLQISCTSMNRIRKFKIDTDISKIPKSRIIKNCTILKNRDVSLKNIEYIGKCLMMEPKVLRSRIDILQELGLKSVGLDEICRFSTLMRKSLMTFKRIYNIPMEKDIMQTIFSNIGASFDHLELGEHEDIHTMKTGSYYKLCIFIYKISYLKIQYETYDLKKRWRYYSLTEISKLVKLLTEEYGFDMKILQKYPELLHLEASNVKEFLTEFQSVEIFGRKLLNIVKAHPKVLFCSTDKIKKFFHIQETLHIPILGVRSCPSVLGMDIERFLLRYSNIGNNYDLGMWVQHPRVISIICRYRSVETRKQCLSSSNFVNNVTINTYLAHKKHFRRVVAGDSDRIASKKYLKYILGKELGKANTILVNSISKHPHWKYIPLLHMENMLQYLKINFSVEDICANIQIILYPQSKIVQVLNVVKEEYISKTGHNFTPKQHLALCLYELERKHHFSGDAVWQSADPDPSNLSSDTLEVVKSDKFDKNIEQFTVRDNKCVNVNEVAWIEYFLRH